MPPSTPAQGKRGAPESGRAPTTSRTFALTPVHRDKLRHRFRKTSQASDAFEQWLPSPNSRHTGKHPEIVRSTFWPARNGVVLPPNTLATVWTVMVSEPGNKGGLASFAMPHRPRFAACAGVCQDHAGAVGRPKVVFKPVIFGTPIVTETQSFPSSAGATVRAPWWLRALSICHSKSVLYGAFVWARRALTVVTGGSTGGITGGDRYPGGRHGHALLPGYSATLS